MAIKKGTGQIGLDIPKRNKPDSDSFDLRGTALEHWISELPRANVGTTAKQLFTALHEVNRLAISWRERRRFLEAIRPAVHYVETQLQKRYIDIPFPLPPKTQQIVQLALTLFNEMALGYKSAMEEMLASHFLGRDNKALTELMHRAVYYLSQALLTSYQTYAQHPENSWFELHLIYLHAELKKLHQRPIRDNENPIISESSIARLYKQILLLALASPHRMRQGEAMSTYHALARWAGHAQIAPYNDPSAVDALFAVHMDSDHAPDYQAFNHRNCNTELCRLVDTRQLSHLLQEEYIYLKKHGRNPEGVSAELLQRLIRSWGVTPRRLFSRNDREASITVVVGHSNLHRTLLMESGDEEQLNMKSSYKSHAVVSASQPTSDDIWNLFSAENSVRKNVEELTQPTTPEKTQPPTLHKWLVRNESAGGYRLAIDPGETARIRVGELLGLHHYYQGDGWEIGVVRWLRQPPEGGLEIGVQVLAPHAMPVMLRRPAKQNTKTDYQPALMLPEMVMIGQQASLITPILLFKAGDNVKLQHPEHEITLKLEEQLQQSGSFSQFRFSSPQVDSARQGSNSSPLEEKNRVTIDWKNL